MEKKKESRVDHDRLKLPWVGELCGWVIIFGVYKTALTFLLLSLTNDVNPTAILVAVLKALVRGSCPLVQTDAFGGVLLAA